MRFVSPPNRRGVFKLKCNIVCLRLQNSRGGMRSPEQMFGRCLCVCVCVCVCVCLCVCLEDVFWSLSGLLFFLLSAQGRVSRMTRRVERCSPPGGPPRGLWAKTRTPSPRVPTSPAPPPPPPSPRERKPSGSPVRSWPQRLAQRRSQVNTHRVTTLAPKLRNVPLSCRLFLTFGSLCVCSHRSPRTYVEENSHTTTLLWSLNAIFSIFRADLLAFKAPLKTFMNISCCSDADVVEVLI